MKIKVSVKPRSLLSEVVSFEDNILYVKIAAIPHKGKSNTELIKTLSTFFKIPKSKISIFLVCVAIFILLRNFNDVPWVGLIVAFSWAFYNVLRKLINVDTDIGLLIESLYILPMSLIVFYFIFKNGQNDFSLENLNLMFMLLLAGPMTVIPLFLYVRGVELSGLGPSGMIFYITPTLQFLLGYFYYNELFSYEKFFSFTIIWIAVIIYLKDLYEKY